MAKKVTVYSTAYCPFCMRAKELLKRKKIAFEEVDLTNDQKKRDEIQEKTGWMTVPMVFIGDEFIGGYDDLSALEADGKLESKVGS